jgi:hypothetical protein
MPKSFLHALCNNKFEPITLTHHLIFSDWHFYLQKEPVCHSHAQRISDAFPLTLFYNKPISLLFSLPL